MRGKQSLVLTHFGRIQRIVVSKHTKILYNLALHLLRSLELQEVRLNHLNVLYIKGNSAKSSHFWGFEYDPPFQLANRVTSV